MTLAALAAAWVGLAALVSRRGAGLVWRLSPAAQAAASLLAAVGLVVLPASALVVTLAAGLAGLDPGGSILHRCGRLVVVLLTDPLARPDLTAALGMLAAWPLAILMGARSAWRSQAASRTFARSATAGPVVAPSNEPFAFTVGMIRPRVVVSEGLLSSSPPQFTPVVLAHEEAHRRGRHPLLLLVVESLARGVPLAPVRRAADLFRLALETAADERAARAVGSRELVAEAVAGVALASMGAPAGFEGDEVQRVRRLLAPPARRPIIASVLVAGVAALVLLAAGHGLHCGEAARLALSVAQCPLP